MGRRGDNKKEKEKEKEKREVELVGPLIVADLLGGFGEVINNYADD